VVVVAGFQGVTPQGEITTLGRGGSDTSAVALGVALSADIVEIYSDVEGVGVVNPALVPQAPYLEEIDFQDMLQLANEGCRVVHPRAIKTLSASPTRRNWHCSPLLPLRRRGKKPLLT